MKIYIIIPAYNEAEFIGETLQSLISQSKPAHKIVVVDDGSTDKTPEIVSEFAKKYPEISLIKNTSEGKHLPGSKVVKAFNLGFNTLDDNFDVICKFDADLIFPKDYPKIVNNNMYCGKVNILIQISVSPILLDLYKIMVLKA